MSFDNHRTMDGKNSSSNQETQSQNPPAVPIMCRTGCGFYANSAFDGMCSKCYKDLSKQSTPQTASASATSSSSVQTSSVSTVLADAASSIKHDVSRTADVLSIPSIETGLPTVRSNVSLSSRDTLDSTDTESELGDTSSDAGSEKPRKKRCTICKKRVGLTGFDCRCGGHFCSTHRYSDTHNCEFDYHLLAQSEIRKCNPVIAAEKVKKI